MFCGLTLRHRKILYYKAAAVCGVSATKFSGIVKLKVLTPRDKADIREFEEVTGSEMQEVDRYVSGGWYVDGYYRCSCGQIWKEEFVEAMQYNGNHAYAVSNFKEDC